MAPRTARPSPPPSTGCSPGRGAPDPDARGLPPPCCYDPGRNPAVKEGAPMSCPKPAPRLVPRLAQRLVQRLLQIALLLLALAAPAVAAETRPIELAVDATDAPRGIFHSRLVIPAEPGAPTLAYPKWSPA